MNDSKLAQREKYTRLRKSSDKLTEALDRISEAGEILTKMTGQLQNIEGKEADTLVKATKALQDSIKSIKEFIQGKPAEKQGISRSSAPTVMSRMQEAALYIGATDLPPGKQEDELLKIAEKVIGEAVQKTNTFFNQPWKNYKKLVEETKINLFKEYTPIE
jgi:Glu-tRNA(Gln) amidotransferase subunit E-like FAD-binding protein